VEGRCKKPETQCHKIEMQDYLPQEEVVAAMFEMTHQLGLWAIAIIVGISVAITLRALGRVGMPRDPWWQWSMILLGIVTPGLIGLTRFSLQAKALLLLASTLATLFAGKRGEGG